MKYIAILVLSLIWSVPSFAQHSHGSEKGPNGGQMEDVAGIDAEILTAGNTITINVFDPANGKPVSTKGFTAAVLVAGGGARETVTLEPSGENALKGTSKNTVGAGASMTLTIKTAEGKSGQAKFGK